MSRFQLGARVSISGTAVKRKTWRAGTMFTDLEWKDGPLPSRTAYPDDQVFTEGVVVGSRTIQNGTVRHSYDEGSYFEPTIGSAQNVWLVAFDLRMKPCMCFDHQVKHRWEWVVLEEHDHSGPDAACKACQPLAKVIEDRMSWPSLHWGELHPDAYPSLARAIHKAGYMRIPQQPASD